jgi:hypothetical protein
MKARSLFKGLLIMYICFQYFGHLFFFFKLLFLNYCAGHGKRKQIPHRKIYHRIFLEWRIYRINYDNVLLFSKTTTSILYARRVVLSWLDRETSNNNNVSISLRPTRQGKNGWLFSWMCKHVPMCITMF